MKFSTSIAVVALGAVVSAVPTKAPAKFAVQIIAKVGNPPVEVKRFLGKEINGAGVTDISKAASCSINEKTELVCGGKTIGASPAPIINYVDMAPMGAVSGSKAIIDGFSVDSNNVLHWKSSKFASLPQVGSVIMAPKSKDPSHPGQGGEAEFGLMVGGVLSSSPKGAVKDSDPISLYLQLGCPGGTHNGGHNTLTVGTSKVFPL